MQRLRTSMAVTPGGVLMPFNSPVPWTEFMQLLTVVA